MALIDGRLTRIAIVIFECLLAYTVFKSSLLLFLTFDMVWYNTWEIHLHDRKLWFSHSQVIFQVHSVFRKFTHWRFWATNVNRKWAFFSFNMPWRYQICIAKCLYSYRDDLHRIYLKFRPRSAKSSLPVDFRRSKTSLDSCGTSPLIRGEQNAHHRYSIGFASNVAKRVELTPLHNK